ncbi:hypothetical protein [Herbaspirillum sp. YR522]|uniref:hypothetical protein n=1 Tax=Herbaspirillum sp. YR522 TaxID=1144342 RepID=UPI00026F772C|nr:hypothetical protein [Herbaspirillum sp. YR522]EJM96373.1 hypothetical protein PMI40_04605 [Herbaspirillum sp. YR522]
MARHRIGNSYLSDDELEDHNFGQWALWVFIIGAIFGGATVHSFLKPLGLPKWLVFMSVILSGAGLGTLAAYLTPYIRMAVGLIFSAAILFGIGWLIWKVI